MNTGNSKNVFIIVLVAILSSVVTLLGYNVINRNNGSSSFSDLPGSRISEEVRAYADSFEQDKNVVLTNLTTSDGYPDFTEAAAKSVDGVVHVKTTTISQQQYINPFDFFFGFGDRMPSQPREQVGYGSGVIISKDGYIITNNHVVDKANEVSVTLNDNREFKAKVVGTDRMSDIALLKIDGDDFPYLTFGNSDALKVGEWVLAVGNPFNLTSTVTAGIVSAKNRGNVMGGGLGIQSFIQIDAAVNPGNSGGALVNTRGELVGINTAIYSQTGNFAGYAFAVPISIAGKIAADLKEYGTVQRALLGIQAPNIEIIGRQDPQKARELSQIKGVLVEDFSDRSAAKAAGIQKGDVINAINNVPIRNFAELQSQLNRYRPGDKISVTVDRNGNSHSFNVELTNNEGSTEITRGTNALNTLGATFKQIPDERKRALGISSGIEVESVKSNGLFRKEGINKGFIIMRINNTPVNSESDVANIVSAANNSQDKVLLIAGFYPNGRTQYIAIDLTSSR
ncbi:periplasmic serine protease [Proteiniphilum saccharofermentans]|uniref:Periplasmic serine protease n=1 Tax=Proteiniphilum saccharofermentans TaxID=1642647 RepID=A0A1R3T652_9BACT|nr:Do family serine endopeptidase [Proteiniphilum saccharofermentans]SCD19435.1 periplasmic serine protease [Proteiniphilum saccharofermentans]SFS30383.1 Do/DeqQ family serine protease [Porphyromonadaceae bacterium NLAE-zl-C104]